MGTKLGGKLNISDAERKARSDRAKALHRRTDPVTGLTMFGGRQPGQGRPKKKRATEVINEKIEAHANEVFEAMLKGLRSPKPFVALQAARQMVEVSKYEYDTQAKEERSLESISTDELVEIVSSRMARLAESGNLTYDFEGTATAIEPARLDEGQGEQDEPQAIAGSGEGNTGLRTSPFARRSSE